MSDSNIIPPSGPTATAASAVLLPEQDQTPIKGVVNAVEAILRERPRVLSQLRRPGQGRLVMAMLLIGIACSLIYGLVVGTFSGGQQLWAAPIKIAAGLLVAGFICLPSLYIFSCLSGSGAKLSEVAGLLAGYLALMAVLLIGFAPIVWVFSQSTESLVAMGVLHMVFWIVATWFSVSFLHSAFAHLNTQSTAAIKVWVMIFLLVQLQMMTALRPIIGSADSFLPKEKKFFLAHWAESVQKPSKPSTQP